MKKPIIIKNKISKFSKSIKVSGDKSIIMPCADPAVFELKKPNENIRGVVR